MESKPFKPKRCKVGKELFVPIKFGQPTCFKHAGEYLRDQRAKKLKVKQREQRKVMRSNIKTYSDWQKELQVLVNRYVRLRDSGGKCISCDRVLRESKGKGGFVDASHFWSQGGNPSVRFDLDNIHSACIYCNRDKHGNLLEYRPRLIKRIGRKRFDALEQRKNTPLKLSIPEIETLKQLYKDKIKTL